MSDDLERLLRERLQRAELPNAPFSLRLEMQAIAQKPPPPIVRRDRSRAVRLLAIAAVLMVGTLAIVVGSGSPRNETALLESPVPSASPSPPTTAAAPASASPSPSAGPAIGEPGPTPAAPPPVLTGDALVRTDAAPIGLEIRIEPGLDGSLFVAVPDPGGTVLTSLDRSGRPRPGWPITIAGAPSCVLLLPVDDGSVRLVCSDQYVGPGIANHARAYAFDADGLPMNGWPVEVAFVTPHDVAARYVGRVIGDDLIVSSYTQVELDHAQVTRVAPTGAIEQGTDVAFSEPVLSWGIGPDGYAYGAGDGTDSTTESRLTSVDVIGRRSGWPIDVDGVASGPAFRASGEIVLTVGSPFDGGGRVIVLDPRGNITSRSASLGIATFSPGDTDCSRPFPQPPSVASDGTTYLVSPVETTMYALDRSLDVRPGWPIVAPGPLALTGYDDPRAELSCRSRAVPAVGPDATLYLPLQARGENVGGRISAIGPDTKVRPGWPVELTRPGAEFWSVVVGSDGTVYALAIEPEAGGTTSATILAIEPDSTVRYANTIIEP